MDKLCMFCGEILQNGVCANEHKYKKMCVNCEYCKMEDNGYTCINADNAQDAKNKMIEAAKATVTSYSIETIDITIKPLAIKRPTNHCPRWKMNPSFLNDIAESFE